MREIIFRGKRTDNDNWVYGDLLTNKKEPEILAYKGQYSVKEGSIGQYTGLLDENGIKIYEGDIVHFKFETGRLGGEHNAVVVYDAEFCSAWSAESPAVYKTPFCLEFPSKHVKVIGNIHDNPDLKLF